MNIMRNKMEEIIMLLRHASMHGKRRNIAKYPNISCR